MTRFVCVECDGRGWVERHIGGGNLRKYECKPCGGTGWIEGEKRMEQEIANKDREDAIEYIDGEIAHNSIRLDSRSRLGLAVGGIPETLRLLQIVRALIEQALKQSRDPREAQPREALEMKSTIYTVKEGRPKNTCCECHQPIWDNVSSPPTKVVCADCVQKRLYYFSKKATGLALAIADVRKKRGWSQRTFALAMECSQNMVRMVESGDRQPSIKMRKFMLENSIPQVLDNK